MSYGPNIHVLWGGTKRSCSTHFVSFRVLSIMSCLFRILLDQGLGVNSRASPYFNSDLYEKHKYATIMKMITIIIIQTLFLHKHPLFISTLGILWETQRCYKNLMNIEQGFSLFVNFVSFSGWSLCKEEEFFFLNRRHYDPPRPPSVLSGLFCHFFVIPIMDSRPPPPSVVPNPTVST